MHALIHEAGLEDYYALQDRAGRPVDAHEADSAKQLPLDRIRARAEETDDGFRVLLYVSGMTCRGCAWLIERIASGAPGLQSAAVSLTTGRIQLVWREGFDFEQFQVELGRFGYALSDVGFGGLSLSPLSLRLILSALFSANGICLLLLHEFAVGGASLNGLFQLLILANLVLLTLMGSTVFIRPAWDALRIRHWHSDIPVAVVHLIGFLLSLFEMIAERTNPILTVSFMLIVPAFLLARLLADHLEMSSRGHGDNIETAPYA